MSFRDRAANRAVARIALPLFALAITWCSVSEAQVFSNQRSVGGVQVDAQNMLTDATVAEQGRIAQEIANNLQAIPQGLEAKTELRKVSLRRVEAAMREAAETGQPLPDAIRLLGGLQEIRYILAYPEDNDILLVGLGEAWKVGKRGTMVGETSGRPVLLLDDLLVALRMASVPKPSVITCSIDPTQEGRRRLQSYTRQFRGDRSQAAAGFERALGPQTITITGVPDTSHFARVLAAADYRMKRIGMGFEPSPVAGMPSFIKMMRTNGTAGKNTMPRWWMEPNYEPMARDADGLAWEIRGAGVKTMTESDFYDSKGVRHETGKVDPIAQKWADNMTARFEELAIADPIFGQLQNCIDLAIAATVIVSNELPGRADCNLPMLISSQETTDLQAPKHVASQATVITRSPRWVIACGGVQLNPWAMVAAAEQSDSLDGVRKETTFKNDGSRWWN